MLGTREGLDPRSVTVAVSDDLRSTSAMQPSRGDLARLVRGIKRRIARAGILFAEDRWIGVSIGQIISLCVSREGTITSNDERYLSSRGSVRGGFGV